MISKSKVKMANIIKLSKKESKLLYHLSLDGRASLGNLAKNLRMSKQGVKYILDKLEAKNIIEGYYAIVDIYKLGYQFYRLFLKFQNISSEDEQKSLDYAKSLKRVGWIVQFQGEYDIDIVIWSKNIKEFESVYLHLLEKFSRHIQERDISVASKIIYYKYRFFEYAKDAKQLTMGETIKNLKLDELDLKLLAHLSKSGRASLVELSKKIGASQKRAWYRKKRLEKAGVILGYNYKLNHKLLGYTHTKIFISMFPFSEESRNQLVYHISQLKEAIYVTIPIGQYDLEFEIMAQTNEELHAIIDGLREKFSNVIKEINSIIFYYEPKINYLPILDI